MKRRTNNNVSCSKSKEQRALHLREKQGASHARLEHDKPVRGVVVTYAVISKFGVLDRHRRLSIHLFPRKRSRKGAESGLIEVEE